MHEMFHMHCSHRAGPAAFTGEAKGHGARAGVTPTGFATTFAKSVGVPPPIAEAPSAPPEAGCGVRVLKDLCLPS